MPANGRWDLIRRLKAKYVNPVLAVNIYSLAFPFRIQHVAGSIPERVLIGDTFPSQSSQSLQTSS